MPLCKVALNFLPSLRPLVLFRRTLAMAAVFVPLATLPAALHATVAPADYDRALGLQEKYRGLVLHLPDEVEWIEGTDRFVYRRTVAGGHEFILVDAEKQTRQPAFDHARLAAALTKELGEPVKPETLPFSHFHLQDNGAALEFVRDRGKERWRCDLAAYTCAKQPAEPGPLVADDDGGYDSTPPAVNGSAHALASPDGNWLAFVENYNVVLRPAHGDPAEAVDQTVRLSLDGSEGNYYALDTLAWSPDSKHLHGLPHSPRLPARGSLH